MSNAEREPGRTPDGAEVPERLISTLAHELRTPLTVILGYAELLRARNDEETRREAPARIVQAAEDLLFVVDDLLTVFAADAGALRVEPVHVDLGGAVADTIRAFESKSEKHRFVNSCREDQCWVSADGEYLARVLTNLLLNAVKYSPNGGDVEVSVQKEAGYAEVSVSDHGLGLTEEELETVFERFAPIELRDHPEIRSTGLELYKVRRLVELHGGSVAAESEPGKGSTFRFRIPLAADEAE